MVLGVVLAYECDVRSERKKRANLERARGGFINGQTRAYGYKVDGRTVIAAEAAVVKEAAERILRGEALRGVCADFNRRRIPSAQKLLWHGTILGKMLAKDGERYR